MSTRHIAFVVESVYGHLVPTLGIASELLRRGYRVSYVVRPLFERKILQLGAEAVIYKPLENKLKLFQQMQRDPDLDPNTIKTLWDSLHKEETEDTHAQLERLYGQDKPDLIVYDVMNPAGRALAKTLRVRAVEHSPLLIEKDNKDWSYDDTLVLVSIPRFFQPHADDLDARFQFTGFIHDGRKAFFDPWPSLLRDKRIILVYATTGLLPQVEFFKTAIAAFGDSSWRLVLSVGDDTTVDSLRPLPSNCSINRSSANIEILETADLVIGQAGTGSTLEAIYCGVPQVLVPPPLPVYEDCASRLAEIGLGTTIRPSELTVGRLKETGQSLMSDIETKKRLSAASRTMQEARGQVLAADLLEQRIANDQLLN